MRSIRITHGRTALVSDEDYECVSAYSWHFAANKYAANDRRNFSRTSGVYLYLHVLIATRMGMDHPGDVDHKDNNGLNCQRENLRSATHSKNLSNRGPQRNNTSGFKGVTFDKSRHKWSASIKVKMKRHNLGRFDTKEDAAAAYNNAASLHFGEFAYQNPIIPTRTSCPRNLKKLSL